MNAAAEARLRRIFRLCQTLEELSQFAEESKPGRRLIELLLHDRGYRLTTRDQVRDVILAVVNEVGASTKDRSTLPSTPPAADTVVRFMPAREAPDGHPTDPSAA